jgi:hypothetical protein
LSTAHIYKALQLSYLRRILWRVARICSSSVAWGERLPTLPRRGRPTWPPPQTRPTPLGPLPTTPHCRTGGNKTFSLSTSLSEVFWSGNSLTPGWLQESVMGFCEKSPPGNRPGLQPIDKSYFTRFLFASGAMLGFFKHFFRRTKTEISTTNGRPRGDGEPPEQKEFSSQGVRI